MSDSKRPGHILVSRRERQIMDILYRQSRATVHEVLAEMPEGLAYSTVRSQLRALEEKGHVRHEERGLQYVYSPSVPRYLARHSALRHLVETYFDGSVEQVLSALLRDSQPGMSAEELDRLSRLIENKRIRDFDPQK